MNGFSALLDKLRENSLTITELADGTGVVLDMSNSQVLSLNNSALLMIQEIRNGTAVDEIPRKISEQFEIDQDTAAKDLKDLLKKLDEEMS